MNQDARNEQARRTAEEMELPEPVAYGAIDDYGNYEVSRNPVCSNGDRLLPEKQVREAIAAALANLTQHAPRGGDAVMTTKDMKYISMERAVELAANLTDGGKKHYTSDEALQALCNAAIADYLNGVGEEALVAVINQQLGEK